MDERRPQAIEAARFEPLASGAGPARRRIPAGRWGLFAMLAVFLGALWFLLAARSLEVVVIAEEAARVEISGFALPFAQRYLLLRGDYDLAVSAPGYRPYAAPLAVSREARQRVEITLQALPGRLSLDTRPAAATLFIDGEVAGETPLEDLAVAAGEHELRIEAPRHRPLTRTLSVTGRNVQQRLSLALQPAWAEVSIATAPAGATLFVDGEARGETPATFEILEGERRLALRRPGYAALQRTLRLEAGAGVDLGTLTLTPATGVLTLTSVPGGANVSVDGEFAGQTPLDLELSPDKDHRISLSRAGYRRATQTLRLAAGATETKSIRLRARLGDVLVRVEPAQAELLVNGETLGRGSRTLSLPAVPQRLEFRLDGYETLRRRVTPRPGLEQLVEVELLTFAAARRARLKPEITTALGQSLLFMDPLDSPRNEFPMGASRREPGRRANEVLHPVRLERPFYIQRREVTNAQFRQFEASHKSGQIEGNSLNREDQPAVRLSWQQAASFCNWLSRREGLEPFYREQQGIVVGFEPAALGYRLPTEAEWAWVARVQGDTLKRFTWGEDFPPTSVQENVADNSSAYVTGRILNGYEDGYVVSAPVGTFPANHRGVFDLGGNVSEWIHDVYTIPAASGVVVTDPLGAQRGDNYTIRGASWALSRLPELRLSYRDYGQAGRDDVGFRLARYAE